MLCPPDPVFSVFLSYKSKGPLTWYLRRLVPNQMWYPSNFVLGPALFILYVDDLARNRPQETNHSLYADNLAIWSSCPGLLKAAQTVQMALDHLKEWTLKWRLSVNPVKYECCFFSIYLQSSTKLRINLRSF